MIFSDVSTKSGIIQSCELLLDFSDGAISGNPTLLKQFTNLVNRAYDNVVAQILKNSGDYDWDDFNYDDFPIATIDLVSGQTDYPLPVAELNSDASTFLRLLAVRVLDTGGRYQRIFHLSENEIPLETQFFDSGAPRGYRELDSSVLLFPAPLTGQVTLTAGLKMLFQRDKADFLYTDGVTTNLTKQPGFPSIYHYLLPLEASESWAAIKGMKQLQFIQLKKAEFTANLGWGMANRNKDQRQQLTPRRTSSYE